MSFQGIFYITVGIFILITGAATVKSSGKTHHSQHSPAVHHSLVNESHHPHVEVALLDFKGDAVKNLSRHHGSYVALPYLDVEDHIWEGFSIQLKCTHNTPVEWVYHGDGAPLVKASTSRLTPIFQNKASFHFGATVVFSHTSYKQTGLYKCESITHPKQHSDLHVFVPGKRVFVHAKENDTSNQHAPIHLTLYANPTNNLIKIPCSTSNPNVSVQLLKEGKDIQEYTKKTHFDPKHGFEIDSEQLTNIWGRYTCVDKATQESITFDAEPSKYVLAGNSVRSQQQQDSNKILTYNVENPFELSHHAHIKFHYEKKRRSLTCCAFDFRGDRLNQNPTMKYSPCETISECNIARTRLDAFTCESSQSPRAVCQGRRMKHHCRRYVLPETDDAGIIECSLGDNAQEYFQYSKIGDIVVTNFSAVPEDKPVLEIVTESPSIPGTRKYTCLANSFFFSEGIKWAIEDHSKHLKFLEDDFPPKISIDIKPEDATKIYCFAPIWNSYGWKNVSIQIA